MERKRQLRGYCKFYHALRGFNPVTLWQEKLVGGVCVLEKTAEEREGQN